MMTATHPSKCGSPGSSDEFSALVAFFRQQNLLWHLISFLRDHLNYTNSDSLDPADSTCARETDETTVLTCQTLLEMSADLSCRQALNSLSVFHHGILDSIIRARRAKIGDSLAERSRIQRMEKVTSQLERVLFGDGAGVFRLPNQRLCPRILPGIRRQQTSACGSSTVARKDKIQQFRKTFRNFLERPVKYDSSMPVQQQTHAINIERLTNSSRRKPGNGQVFREEGTTVACRLDQNLLETIGESVQYQHRKECPSHRELLQSDVVDYDERYFRRIYVTANCATFTGQEQSIIVFGKDAVRSFRVKDDGAEIVQAQECHGALDIDSNGRGACRVTYLGSSAAMPGVFLSSCNFDSSSIWINSDGNGVFHLGRHYLSFRKLALTNSHSQLAVGEDPDQYPYRAFTLNLETGQRIVKLSYPLRDFRPWHKSYKQIARSQERNNIYLSTSCDPKPCYHPSDKIISHQRALFDSSTGKFIFKFDDFYVFGQDLVFHPNGNHVQIDSELWDLRSLKLRASVCTLNQRATQYSSSGDVLYATDVLKWSGERPYPDCIPRQERKMFLDVMDSGTFENLAKIPIVPYITSFLVNQSDNSIVLLQPN